MRGAGLAARWWWLALLVACQGVTGVKKIKPLPGCKPALPERSALQVEVSQEDVARGDTRALLMQLDRVTRPASEQPTVVMIVLDTFRADRLAAYGSERGLTPNLDAFADQARVFTEMVSPGTWTLPSHGALFTGLYAVEHGARGAEPGSRTRAYQLRKDVPTLAERMADAGYVTAGVAANRAFLDRVWGLSRGFDIWFCRRLRPQDGIPYVQGDRITHLGSSALRYYRNDAPLFLFLNYMDTHTPWIPRDGYVADPSRIDPLVLPQGGEWQGVGGWGRARASILANRRAPTERELSTWEEAYDAEVRYLDEQVGALLDGLEGFGVGEEDYVIILSDHGEFLGEHNLLEHSKDVFEPVIRVPLMIRGPGFEPGVDDRPIQTNDVPNLLLEALGLEPLTQPDPDETLQVTELYWSRSRDRKFPEVAERFDRIRRGFQDDGQKVIQDTFGNREAYDLGADPGELRDVAGEAQWAAELELRAEAWMSRRQEATGEDVELTEEQEAELRALGYLD